MAKEEVPISVPINLNVNVDKQDHRSVGLLAEHIDKVAYDFAEMFALKNSGHKGSKTPKTMEISRLEQALILQDRAMLYIKEGKPDEAYGFMCRQYKLGPRASFAPFLIDYYVTLIKTGRERKSDKIRDELTAVIRDDVHGLPEECKQLASKYLDQDEHVKAILFYQIATSLCNFDKVGDEILLIMQGCIIGIKLCVVALIENIPSLRPYIRDQVLPSMRLIRDRIHNFRSIDMRLTYLVEAFCLHHIEVIEGMLCDFDAAEKALKTSIELMRKNFGSAVVKYHVYGTALNNLGANYLRKHLPREALDALNQAIEANRLAEDFDSEDERQLDISRSEAAKQKVENILNQLEAVK